MKKRTYHITGFDCPNCALKAERHLNQKDPIECASIDYASETLFITYKDKECSIEELLKYIKEVEVDPIRIVKSDKFTKMKHEVFTTKFILNLIRIIVCSALIFGAKFGYPGEKQLSIPAIIIYSLALVLAICDIFYKFVRQIIKLQNPIDEYFLMMLASIIIFLISLFPLLNPEKFGSVEAPFFEGVMVIILFQLGELFETIAANKSKDAISSAIDIRAATANLISDNRVVKIAPEDLKVGDLIVVNVGEIVPADGVIVSGDGSFDMSSLSGEVTPIKIALGELALSGSILRSGSITIRVDKVFKDSTISKILALVEESSSKKSKAEKFIAKFVKIYTPSVLGVALIFTLIYGLVGQFALHQVDAWISALNKGVKLLILGCPCAIVISVPLAYFAGSGLCSRHGVVVKGSTYLDLLAEVKTLFLDKTGTLTYGTFQSQKFVPFGVSEDELKRYLLIAESRSNHPIAKALNLHKNTAKVALIVKKYEEIAGFGVKAIYENHVVFAGTKALLNDNQIEVPEIDELGTIVYVGVDQKFIGYAVLGDVVRDKAKQLISLLKKIDVHSVLLSGDQLPLVKKVADEVGIIDYQAELLPLQKAEVVKNAKKTSKGVIAFAGDGVNDAPSIVSADVGFSMGGIGSDIAVEKSDVVIMQDHPLKIYDALIIAQKTRRTAIFNIFFTLIVKLIVAILVLVGVLDNLKFNGFDIGMFITILSDSGVALLMVLNSLFLLFRKVKYDEK